MKGRPWTEEELTTLLELYARREPWAEIARAVKHTIGSCTMTAYRMGILRVRGPYAKSSNQEGQIQPVKKSRRPCLNNRCKKPFWSEGKHNRFCAECRHESLSPFDVEVSVLRR